MWGENYIELCGYFLKRPSHFNWDGKVEDQTPWIILSGTVGYGGFPMISPGTLSFLGLRTTAVRAAKDYTAF